MIQCQQQKATSGILGFFLQDLKISDFTESYSINKKGKHSGPQC